MRSTGAAHETECPRGDCDGSIEFFEETGEDYTAHGLSVWSYTYLVMDGDQCSEGHQFTSKEVKQMETDATEVAQDQSWRYEP